MTEKFGEPAATAYRRLRLRRRRSCGSKHRTGRSRMTPIASSAPRFLNFREALTFVQQVGELAETEGHHP